MKCWVSLAYGAAIFAFGCGGGGGGEGTWDGTYEAPSGENTIDEPALSSEGPNERGKKELAECDYEDLSVSDLVNGPSNGDIKKPGSDRALNYSELTTTDISITIYSILCRPASEVGP